MAKPPKISVLFAHTLWPLTKRVFVVSALSLLLLPLFFLTRGGTNAPHAYAATMVIPGGLEMTTSNDVLEALATGAGPRRVLVTLGYAAWGEGQLESELAENSWLTVGADVSVIFDTPVEQRYDTALGLLGLEAWRLSPGAGHA